MAHLMDVAKREDALLESLHDLYRTRRQTIRTCQDMAAANPDLAVFMDWVLTVGVEATEKELQRDR